MKKITMGLVALAAVAFAGSAQAQAMPVSPFSVEVRGGLAFPTGDLNDVADSGITVGANGTYMFTPMLGLYAGFTYNSFSLGEEADDLDVDGSVNTYGFDAGVKAMFGSPTLPVTPFLKGGLVYHKLQLEIEDIDLGEDDDTDFGLGFEVGGGVMVPLGPRLSFTPAVSYTSFKPNFQGEDETDEDKVNSFRVDVGLNIRF
ncbi:MAG TPA: outer membrane beta-barrel protein [Longimicrobium sp.]|jgi:opacity protein-like surface antigen